MSVVKLVWILQTVNKCSWLMLVLYPGMRNFAEHKQAVQSSTLFYKNFSWSADKAVDGIKVGRSSPDSSGTCSATDVVRGNHTWEVDIVYPVLVNSINVYGRSDNVDQVSGFQLFIGNVSNSWSSGRRLTSISSSDSTYQFQANYPLVRFVSVIRINSDILTLCEIEVNGECPDGNYSDFCNETCGSCYKGQPCNKTTGECLGGCNKGWSGIHCDQECKHGTYGYGCNETCGKCQGGNNNCSITEGTCTVGCEVGWRGVTCKQECDSGTYGLGCNETCGMCLNGNTSCSRTNGLCKDGCKPGWRETICKLECENGTYGYGCNETCGMCMNGNNSCSKTNGKCKDGCEAGWKDGVCKLECDIGSYGYGCNETCGMCMNGNNSCSTTNGKCKDGCEAGWKDDVCKLECDIGSYGYGCNETCGMCINGNNSCSKTNGKCKDGCEVGWKDDVCKLECNSGSYGYGCNETCGMCMNGNNSCSKTNGKCKDGCEAGWKDDVCKLECDIGSYGYGCNETCGMCMNGNNSCSTTNGKCKGGCVAGWREGTCNIECETGTYGYGCINTCGNCLKGNELCLKTNGTCIDGCQAGWQNETCTQECENGKYGLGCNGSCGMCSRGKNSCSKIDGSCITGCQDGWNGDLCKLPYTKEDNTSIIIGVVVAVIVVVIAAAVLIVLTVRRRSKGRLDGHGGWKQEQRVLRKSEEIEAKELEEIGVAQELVYQNTNQKAKQTAQCINVLSFWDHVMKKKANKEEYESEFQEFTQGLTKTHNAALANPSKNRYKSMYPYDLNRVVLKRISPKDSEYEEDSDYINASHIKGYEGRKYYIAAQGPTEKTVEDFWWMVWQEQSLLIVMLTNTTEQGKVKCMQYWPDEDERMYGNVLVKILRNESFPDYIRRDLQITLGGKSRNVAQFHYKAWPDKDVPDTAWSLVGFWKAVKKYKQYDIGPMIVHCSAGVGRTGTFIALDIIYDEACEKDNVTAIQCVEQLREQRVNMVQTAKQYMFMHDAVAEALGFGTVPVLTTQFPDVLRYLMEKDEISGCTRLERQYNILMNIDLSRDSRNVPIYSNDEDFQFDFIWLPNLSGIDAYIVVKGIYNEKFLAFIQQRNIKCMINVDDTSPKNVLVTLGVNQTKTVADLEITCCGYEDNDAFDRKQFLITDDKTGMIDLQRETYFTPKLKQNLKDLNVYWQTKCVENWTYLSQKLTMFSLKALKDSQMLPSASSSVLMLLDAVTHWHPGPSGSDPLLLYSRGEVNICGLMHILLNEKYRIRGDGEIHILRTSAEMLARSRTLLPSFEQYVFLYKCLATDVSPESTYENIAAARSMNKIL